MFSIHETQERYQELVRTAELAAELAQPLMDAAASKSLAGMIREAELQIMLQRHSDESQDIPEDQKDS